MAQLRDYMEHSKKGNVVSVEDLLKANSNNKHEVIDTSILGLKEQKQIEELLDKQAKEIEDCWKKDDAILKKTLKMQDIPYETIEKDMKKEVPTLIVKTAIEGLFPFAEYFSEDGQSKIYKSIGSFVFDPNKKEATDELLDELGVLNIVRQLFTMNNTENVDKFIKHVTNSKTNVEILRKSKGNLLKQAINSVKLRLLIGRYNISIIWNSMRSFAFMKQTYMFNPKDVEAMGNMLKGYGKSLGKDVGVAFLKGIVELWKTSYEKLEENYNEIMHTRYTNKFNDTYAVKNISYEPYSNETSEYTYYPIEIYSSFINIDLKRTIIGGRLSSGGLDYHNFFYYDINTTTNKLDSNLSKDISLDTMISYLCLDELRTDNKTDEEFFNNLNKRNKKLAYSPKELMLQGVKTLLTISPSNPIDIKQREKIYDLYSQGVEEGTELPIDKYNEAMEILEDFKNGNLNTFGSEVDNKSRRLLKALDVIGNNNVKGMYVGCKIEHGKKSAREIPPRLIGRLATTIIMEDGLYIG